MSTWIVTKDHVLLENKHETTTRKIRSLVVHAQYKGGGHCCCSNSYHLCAYAFYYYWFVNLDSIEIMITPKYRYENVKCTRVVDGDTIDVIIDFGFKLTLAMRLRLSRINAPETRGKEKIEGMESKQKLVTLIEGKDIIIETEKQGKYGRYLAEIYYGSMNMNDWLVEKGFAKYKQY